MGARGREGEIDREREIEGGFHTEYLKWKPFFTVKNEKTEFWMGLRKGGGGRGWNFSINTVFVNGVYV